MALIFRGHRGTPVPAPRNTVRGGKGAHIALLILLINFHCAAQSLIVKPFNASDIYAIGEKVGWTVSLAPAADPANPYSYTIKKNNFTLIKKGVLDFSAGPATIETTSDEPAMLYVQITSPADPAPPRDVPPGDILGAAVGPRGLQPSVARPTDFDDFWAAKIALLQAIPANPVLTPQPSGVANVDYALIQMDNINGGHIHGQIAKPSGDGKFPALAVFQWAGGPYPLEKNWATDHARDGWLTLNIEPHDVLPTEPKAYYKALPRKLRSYQAIGNDDRDKCYFLQMYLADYRAVEYLASRPDWDGKTLVVMGTSMGGQQSLCVAGLNHRITHLIVEEPSGCDSNGPLHGRASGYPNWPADNPKIMQTALYFDPVNFAPHITAPCLVAMGFIDTTAPPVGIWTAFNQIAGPKQAVPLVDCMHNNLATDEQQQPYYFQSYQWLHTLVKGGEVKPSEQSNMSMPADRRLPADQSVERFDANSRLAHQQLLAKAAAGRIDVYFEGDSITRRWGATDRMYEPFLANWKQNFFGWNAADFGWGGDTTQNILWRLQNGELDHVNPKIIVLMAGTNNVGNIARTDDDAAAADISRGIKTILDLCQQKAPNAKIILMGITPRNDNMAVMPLIDKINARIAQFADGDKIRFVNINDKLADENGRLYEGMTGDDKLHLDLKAYQIWADALKPIFTEILGAPAAVDSAPPPTGDPSAK